VEKVVSSKECTLFTGNPGKVTDRLQLRKLTQGAPLLENLMRTVALALVCNAAA
jgi:hypothetical protein